MGYGQWYENAPGELLVPQRPCLATAAPDVSIHPSAKTIVAPHRDEMLQRCCAGAARSDLFDAGRYPRYEKVMRLTSSAVPHGLFQIQ